MQRPKTQDPRPQQKVVAILLAAGRSSRMGAFKPLLPFGDTTVIRSCLNHLRSAGLHEIVVVLGHRATDVREHLQDLDLTFALNPDPASEMSESIACGVRQLSLDARAVVIGLADHPAVPSEVITALIGQWRSEGKLIIPDFKGRGGHSVRAILARNPTKAVRESSNLSGRCCGVFDWADN